MNLTEGTLGWFTPYGGGQRIRAKVIKVWGPQCVNVQMDDGTVHSSVLIKQEGCVGYHFEPDQVDAVEQEIRDKGLTAPRVTPADIEAEIVGAFYFTAREGVLGSLAADGVPATAYEAANAAPPALGLLTFCVLLLRNGFTVTGESACASPENFDEELGRKIARQAAVNKIWPLMGFALKSRLAGPSDAMVNRFLTWPVPANVYPDGQPGQPGRTGTNLLNAEQAKAMLQHVLSG